VLKLDVNVHLAELLVQRDYPTFLPNPGTGFAAFTSHPKILLADKTRYIEKLDAKPSYQYMFLRPRRFGKSTFLKTLTQYYDKGLAHEFKSFFGDLYIGEKPTVAASSLLVLRFNFAEISWSNIEETKVSFDDHINTTLDYFLSRYEEFLSPFDRGKLLDRQSGRKSLKNVLVRGWFSAPLFFGCLQALLQNLVKRSDEHLFVGVDEYDAPATAALFSSPEQYTKLAELFNTNFFAVIKDTSEDDIIDKYWLTGVLPAFRDGVSPLIATHIISDNPEYHGICGLTDAEVRTITTAYLGPTVVDNAMKVLQKWYDGYQFCRPDDPTPDSLYNPQLVFAHLMDMRSRGETQRSNYEPKDEIEAMHSNNVIQAMPQKGDVSFLDMFLRAASGNLDEKVHHSFSARELGDHESCPWITPTLLYFFGIFSYQKGFNGLKIPNHTMRQLVRMITMYRIQAILDHFSRFECDSTNSSQKTMDCYPNSLVAPNRISLLRNRNILFNFWSNFSNHGLSVLSGI
jgi:hypothetical protein